MERAIFDTDLYIDWIRAGLREELILEASLLRYMSSVVLMELRAGAFTTPTRRVVDSLHETFSRTRRLVSPTVETFWQAGQLLSTVQQRFGYDLKKRLRLVNDCLIALSCRQIGATLFTRNARDFTSLQQVAPFKMTIVD